MAFINYDLREDMQDDTYKIVAIRLDQALEAIILKEAELALSIIEALFLLIGGRLKRETEIEKQIDAITNVLFGKGRKDGQLRTIALDDCKKVLRDIARDLDKAGILLRAEANPGEMYKRGGRG